MSIPHGPWDFAVLDQVTHVDHRSQVCHVLDRAARTHMRGK
jgi:hypothetical protein